MTISIKQAAFDMGIDQETLRVGLRNGTFPVGCAIRSTTGRYTYIIPRTAFERFMTTGKCTIDELMDAMRKIDRGES